MRSNPAFPTRKVSNCNQLRPRCKQVAKFTFPHRTSLSHHGWPNQGALRWRSPNTGVGRGVPQWRSWSTTGNKSSHCKGEKFPREPLCFHSLSVFPIQPHAQSPHPDTSINAFLFPQIPRSIHHSPLGSMSFSIPNPTIPSFPLLPPYPKLPIIEREGKIMRAMFGDLT